MLHSLRFLQTRRWQKLSLVAGLAIATCVGGTVVAARFAAQRRQVSLEKIDASVKKLSSLDVKKTPGSWMQAHPEEAQAFGAYRAWRTKPLTWEYSTMYVQPLGSFSDEQQAIIEVTRDYLTRLFGVPVKQLTALSDEAIPEVARRMHPSGGQPQVLSTYILNTILKPRRPKDGLAVLGLTATDLWPGEGWNFVFGQASLEDRVGVWSLNRYGDPAASEAERMLCLRRTLKVAGHETGHMLGLKHCTRWECGMNGSNHREEMDEIRMPFCAECAAKVWWSTDRDPAAWYDSLIEFAEEQNLEEEAAYWRMYRERLTRAK